MRLRTVSYGTGALVTTVLVAGILVIVNAFSYRHFTRVDLTENKRFTISESTREVLAGLDDVVNIQVYLSEKLPPYMVTITDQIKDILEEYQVYGRGSIAVEYSDPGDDPATQQKLRFMGIPQLRLNIIEKDQAAVANVYMGLAVLYGDNKEIIPALTDLETFEYELTSKIVRITSETVQTVGFLAGHGEPSIAGELATVNNLLKEQYYTKTVQTGGGEKIPADIAALVVAGPRDMTERDLFEIDQYLMSGGKVLFLLDAIDVQQQRGMQATPLKTPALDLLAHYGVTVQPELVLDQLNANASFQSGMFNIFVPYPFWVRAVRQNLEADHPIVSGLESLVLPWVSPLKVDTEKLGENELTVLARSSQYSWVQKGYFDLNPRQDFYPGSGQPQPQVLAIAVQGTFKSYFAGKAVPPVEKDDKAADAAPAGDADRSVIPESPETRIIVAGTSRFITGNFPEQFEGNRTFFQNAVDWFVIGDQLMGIRSREAGERPLQIVSDDVKAIVRALNLLAVPLLLALFGIVQYLARRRRKRLGIAW